MYYFVTLLFLLLTAKGTFLYYTNAYWFILDGIFIWIGLEKDRFTLRDIRIIFGVSVVYIAFMSIRYFFLNHLSSDYYISDIVFLFKYILISFLFCAVMKEKAIEYIARLIVYGAMISIPLYFLQLFIGDAILAVGKMINLRPDMGSDYTNFIVFTYSKLHAVRNSGFAWEPGANGCFLNIGLMLNLLINNFTFDKKCWWLVIAIFTTLSTTSYLALLIILLLYYRVNGGKINKLVLFAGPVLFIAAFQIPFLVTKIIDIYNHDLSDLNDLDNLSQYYLLNGGQLPLNRFSSLIYLYNLYDYKLIWGISNSYQDSVPILQNINISNGIIDFCAKFGVIGLVFMLYKYISFLKLYLVKNEHVLYCVLTILVLSFGEPILILPIFLIFIFINYYLSAEMIEESYEYEE
jgi:hypothetical protein